METVSLVYNFKGRWVHIPKLAYIEGDTQLFENYDIDLLSFTHMLKLYKENYGMSDVKKLCYVMPGVLVENAELIVLQNDEGIKKLSELCRSFKKDELLRLYPAFEVNENEQERGIESSQIGNKNAPKRGTGTNEIGIENALEETNDDVILGELMDSIINEGGELPNQPTNEQPNQSVNEKEAEHIDVEVGESEDYSTNSNSESIDLHLLKQSRRKVKYDIDDNNPHFILGMTFKDAEEARLAIRRYSVQKCTPLRIRPNDAVRLRAKCKTQGCPFHLYISKESSTGCMMVRRIDGEHNCLKDGNNTLASYKFLATEFKSKLYENPKTTVKEIIKEAEKNMKLYVSDSKGKRTKKLVLNELDGSFKAEFAGIASYVHSISEKDPNTTVELELCDESASQGKFVFKRVYLCFEALKRGWRSGCRPIIGLDGCHLKGVVKGQLLVAVGKDADEQLYPIAWAVIGIENKDSWSWFLQLLVKDLFIDDGGRKLTIMSDMQKGLVNAVSKVLSHAEHRYCARHVYANWSKKWHGGELKKRFWVCAWSTYKEEFEDNLKILGDISKQAAEDFVAYNPQVFCRAFFSSRSKSWMVDNNISESFNASILEARYKPIVSMLDAIRLNAMNRLATNKVLCEKWTSEWSPTCMQHYQDNLEKAFGCKVMFNGANGYEIGDGDDRQTVFLDRLICTCRSWELTGIPCTHAICALKHAKRDPKAFISMWYHKSAYMASYEVPIQPMAGKLFKINDRFVPIEPPNAIKLTGRPKSKRIRGANESGKGNTRGKMSKKGVVISCSLCQTAGHNKAKCPSKNSQTSSRLGSQTTIAEPTRKNTRTSGLGILIDENSGTTILNPGFPSERLVSQHDPISSQTLSSNPDVNVRFSVPNEREIRKATQSTKVFSSSGTRPIAFAGEGTSSIAPGNLPFKPPGLKWKGKRAITTKQLQNERDQKKVKKGGTNKSTN